jgi:hypothetical protein
MGPNRRAQERQATAARAAQEAKRAEAKRAEAERNTTRRKSHGLVERMNKKICATLVGAVILHMAVSSTAAQNLADYVAKADQAERDLDFREATIWYQKAAELAPLNPKMP